VSGVGDENTPEWKRRLARGEDIAGDGCDLFGPTRLEGIFKQPATPRERLENIPPSAFAPAKPWSMPESYQSMRASKSRIPEMEILAEEDEDDVDHDISGANGDSSRKRALRGVVKERVLSLEHNNIESSPSAARHESVGRDPRMRTSSGQEEIENEEISPITTSRQNTIRERALKRLTEVPVDMLYSKLEDVAERPSSTSSDDGVLYGHEGETHEEYEEITSLSLPDDLSMGTQDFATRGGFINYRRGGRSNENSFQKKTLSSSVPASLEHSVVDPRVMHFRSSPPPYITTLPPSQEPRIGAPALPSTPQRGQDTDSTGRPRSSGSPLKLFGNYDTFTNNKLLRRMSQFEHDDVENLSENHEAPGRHNQDDVRISHFGKGDLDTFSFDKRVEREPVLPSFHHPARTPIFDSVVIDEATARSVDLLTGSNVHATEEVEQVELAAEHGTGEGKRVPSSSIKDRTPKRRRTLLRCEIDLMPGVTVSAAPWSNKEATQLAGQKRKDARYDLAESAADPATLASRQMLRPRPALQRRSTPTVNGSVDQVQQLEGGEGEDKITEELAGELASFGIGITQIANDSRKPSVTTQDFLNEATKIMQIIRERGKPKSGLTSVEEPHDEPEVNADSILDLDIEGEDTTVDNFSRPPSRTGSMRFRGAMMAAPDPSVVSHLQKYQDGDDLDLLITSKLGSLHLLPEPHAEEAALVPLPDDNPEGEEEHSSSPANIRIRESGEHQRKRKHSISTVEGPPSLPTHASSGTSTGTTIPTCSSASSGNKGRIPPGTVLVPDQVGAMTFDHSTKSWIRGKGQQILSPTSRKANSEEDPFGDIPDLSIDEQTEAKRRALANEQVGSSMRSLGALVTGPPASCRPQTRNDAKILPSETASGETKFTRIDSSMPGADTRATSWATAGLQPRTEPQTVDNLGDDTSPDHDEEVEHEIRIHDGRASEAPPSPQRSSKKARAVTIAFSSPLVSAIAYHDDHTLSEIDHTVVSDGLQKSGEGSPPVKTRSTPSRIKSSGSGQARSQPNTGIFIGRPVSRIDEQDEDIAGYDLSVVYARQPNSMTPAHKSISRPPVTSGKAPSAICLTPLSEFSVHQVDQPRHLEASYVERRAHPTSLQQAHGNLALAVDELIKAITDAEPYELYWEHIRRLDLSRKRLSTLHRLGKYCSAVEELHVSNNELSQLSGVPVSVRTLLAPNNCLSSLTSWAHLQNLQYLDISGNELESLDGLSCLAHLRELKANNNRIHDMEGIFDLDALLHLELQSNELSQVDFEGGELIRLHHLDLSDNRLTTVRNISALPALQTLHLERNVLRQFGAPHESYPFLHDLRLSFNQIEVIDLARAPWIKVLYLDNNRIKSIQGLSTARHLNTLSLREQIDSPQILNTIMSASSECRKLYLSSNPSPPDGLMMPSLPHLSLKYLELASCGLTSLPPDFGSKIPNCRTLNLNFNAVKDPQPLKGSVRLNKLMMAGNRLNKLRRTCIALTRLPALTKIDLRDNPLTVGFYPPFRDGRLVAQGDISAKVQDPYTLAPGDLALDSKWVSHLDEGTRMKRRTIELFFAKGCEKLIELDGLTFDRVAFLRQDEIWQKLTSMGVISKTGRISTTSREVDEDEILPLDADVGRAADDRERSLLIE
jgi:protein NUD1